MHEKTLYKSSFSNPPHPAKHPLTFKDKILANKAMVGLGVILLASVLMTLYLLLAPSYQDQHLSARASLDNSFSIPTNTPVTPISALTPTVVTPAPTQIPTPTPPVPTPTTSATSHWNTYVNSQYNYTIKYPINWTVTNWGALEPKVPSYIVFNENTSTASARFISVAISTRPYTEQLAIEGGNGTPITVAGITGSKQNFKDSDGNQSTSVILPRSSDLIMLRSKIPYVAIFNLMLSTLQITK